VRFRKLRLKLNRMPEQIARAKMCVARELVKVPGALTDQIPRIEISGSCDCRLALRSQQFGLDRASDLSGDFILDRENVRLDAVELLGPDMRTDAGIDELRRNPHAIRGSPHAALQHVPDAEFPRDLAIGTIEHANAIDNIGEIVTTPGLDLAFIGPGDLATSMGFKGRPDAPEVQAAIAVLEAAIVNSPVVLGGVAPTADAANSMIARGYRALVLGFDWSLLQRGIASALNGIVR
jgi:hypothetical protein